MTCITKPAPFLLSAAAEKYPAHPACITPEFVLDYAAYDALAARAAENLLQHARPGARAGIYLPQDWRYPVLLMAMLRAGIVAVPVSRRLPVSQAPALCASAGCELLIGDMACLAGAGAPALRMVRLQAILPASSAAAGRAAPAVIDPAQEATIIFTSGSAGEPKGVLHDYQAHWYSAEGANRNIAFGPGDRWLLSLPLYHVGGYAILFRAALGGGAVVAPAPELPLAGAIEKYSVTHVSLVATQLHRLLASRSGRRAAHRLRAILLGGSAIPAALIAAACALELPLFTTYGSTEMASQITTTRAGDAPAKLRTSGVPLPHRELRISPQGEIQVRGKTLFRGYVEGLHRRRPVDAQGWFATGDLGSVDAEGYLHVVGRVDNMFISGGENIQPEEIERALGEIDGVARAVVVPVANAAFGRRPVAFVSLCGSRDLPVLLFRHELARRLPRFKIPDAFLPWPADAQAGMKIDRQWLAKCAQERLANRHMP